jgi:hypothetical protein
MQAILTRYLSPTDRHGARIKATAWAGSETIAVDHSLDVEARHVAAALALRDKLGWKQPFVTGCLADGNYAHVLIPTLADAIESVQADFEPEAHTHRFIFSPDTRAGHPVYVCADCGFEGVQTYGEDAK